MKHRETPTRWLKGYHWEDLANLHVELRFLRHRLILAMNEQISTQGLDNLETLEKLAQVDDLFSTAADTLEKAKAILFTICYERHPSGSRHGKAKGP